MPKRRTFWMCSFGCYGTYASKRTCEMHEERCWMNPASKPLALLPRGILPGDRVGWKPTEGGFFSKTGDLLAYTAQGAYVWTYSGTAFVDVERIKPVIEQ